MPSVLASCASCTWEQERSTEAEATAALQRHEALRHGGPAPLLSTPAMSRVMWELAGLDRIAALPYGVQVTLFEACQGLQDPPHTNGWQSLAGKARALGLIEKVRGVESKRPGTKSSMTTLWRRTALNPDLRRAV